MVFKSFVGDARNGTRPSQLETNRNMNNEMMSGARLRPLGPIVTSICSCKPVMTISSIFCQPEGTSFRLRVAKNAMRITMAMAIHVISRVSTLKVIPANCTISRTPISCIRTTSLTWNYFLSSRVKLSSTSRSRASTENSKNPLTTDQKTGTEI